MVILRKEDKIYETDRLDKMIKAKLPDPNDKRQKRLFEIITKQMIHGPCGRFNPSSVCMDHLTGKCTKEFPKKFNETTNMNENGFPAYARPDNGVHFKKYINSKETGKSTQKKMALRRKRSISTPTLNSYSQTPKNGCRSTQNFEIYSNLHHRRLKNRRKLIMLS